MPCAKLTLITIEPISTNSFPHIFDVIPLALFSASSLKYDHKAKGRPSYQTSAPPLKQQSLQRRDDGLYASFRISKQHVGVVVVEKRIHNTCVASIAHAALECDDMVGLPHF